MNKALEVLQLFVDFLWLWRHYDERPQFYITREGLRLKLHAVAHPDTQVFRRWKPEPREPRLKWKEGTVITCPTCKSRIATARRDIYSFDQKSFDDWDWHRGYFKGMVMICPHDGSNLERKYDGREHLHTERGWIG